MPQLNAMEDFRREVSYHVLRREDDTILLTATMTDRFHDILLTVVVAPESLTVREAAVDFRRAPSTDCPDAADRVAQLAGLVIGPGLNRRLQALFSGECGCGNLRSLLTGLLPLAMNVRAAAGFSDEQEVLDVIHNRLVGSCAGYAKPLHRHREA